MKMTPSFLSGRDNIFTDNDEKNNCVDDKDVPNPNNSNKNPRRKTKIKKIQKRKQEEK